MAAVASAVPANRCRVRAMVVARRRSRVLAHQRPATGVPATGTRTRAPLRISARTMWPERQHGSLTGPDGGEGLRFAA